MVDRGKSKKKGGHHRWNVYTPGDRECPINPKIAALAAKIQILEAELEAELAQRRAVLSVGLERGRAFFEEEILRRHRELRTRLSTYLLNARPLVVLTAPVIYAMIVPLVLLDFFVSIYQRVCFPVYGIPNMNRGDYLIFDRHHLAYLNALEKLNCAYCSYANGLIAYVREIAGRTEQYWCPIKHARRALGLIPAIVRSRTTAMPRNTGSGSSSSIGIRQDIDKRPVFGLSRAISSRASTDFAASR